MSRLAPLRCSLPSLRNKQCLEDSGSESRESRRAVCVARGKGGNEALFRGGAIKNTHGAIEVKAATARKSDDEDSRAGHGARVRVVLCARAHASFRSCT